MRVAAELMVDGHLVAAIICETQATVCTLVVRLGELHSIPRRHPGILLQSEKCLDLLTHRWLGRSDTLHTGCSHLDSPATISLLSDGELENS